MHDMGGASGAGQPIMTSSDQVPRLLVTAPQRRSLAGPRPIAILCVLVLTAAGWIELGLTLAAEPRPFAAVPWLDGIAGRLIGALCGPTLGSSAPTAGPMLLMWCAMVLAMMVPTAAPMVMTYAEIAEIAHQRDEHVASPAMLVAGYVVVWLGFALAATGVHWILMRAAPVNPTLAAASGLISAAIFLGAGFFQFSTLKQACLALCQRPFPFFFANWTTKPAGVFRLGLRQGLYCVGCCWAMMLIMFAVGVMNVVWMAALGAVMAIEKIGTGVRFSRAVGVVLLVIGAVFLGSSIAAHWSARSF